MCSFAVIPVTGSLNLCRGWRVLKAQLGSRAGGGFQSVQGMEGTGGNSEVPVRQRESSHRSLLKLWPTFWEHEELFQVWGSWNGERVPKLAAQCLRFLCINVAPQDSYLAEGRDVAYPCLYCSPHLTLLLWAPRTIARCKGTLRPLMHLGRSRCITHFLTGYWLDTCSSGTWETFHRRPFVVQK